MESIVTGVNGMSQIAMGVSIWGESAHSALLHTSISKTEHARYAGKERTAKIARHAPPFPIAQQDREDNQSQLALHVQKETKWRKDFANHAPEQVME